MQTDILIIGGGLSGLGLAEHLHAAGRDYVLVEARNRFGGRIKTETSDGAYFDMGPAWFWPGQPRLAALIDRMGLEQFDQFYAGDLMFEDEKAHVQRGREQAAMQGAFRLNGGLQALTDALAKTLPDQSLKTGMAVNSLTHRKDGVTATFENGDTLSARQVVLALPPRVAEHSITFSPKLPDHTKGRMRAIPTWMAGQAKAVAIYDTPFWREAGLSGDAISRHGPMVEIHDASPLTGGPHALFGFIGIPPKARSNATQLKSDVTAQFTRLFGAQAATPVAVHIKDWATDIRTATDLDQAPLYAHPRYGLPAELTGLWDGRLHFAGTEVAPQFGGFLEGALEAAENVLSRIKP